MDQPNNQQANDTVPESVSNTPASRLSLPLLGTLVAVLVALFLGTVFLALQQRGEQTPLPVPAEEVNQAEREAQLQAQADELIATNDLSRCEEIADDMYRKVCINNVAINQAMETGDASWCELVDGELLQEEDCRSFAGIQNTPEVCEALSGEERTNCFYGLVFAEAVSLEDPSLCGQLEDEASVVICHNQTILAGESPGAFSCDLLQGVDVQTDCRYINTAVTEAIRAEEPPDIDCNNLLTGYFEPLCSSF
jgi:hypothetical protein